MGHGVSCGFHWTEPIRQGGRSASRLSGDRAVAAFAQGHENPEPVEGKLAPACFLYSFASVSPSEPRILPVDDGCTALGQGLLQSNEIAYVNSLDSYYMKRECPILRKNMKKCKGLREDPGLQSKSGQIQVGVS